MALCWMIVDGFHGFRNTYIRIPGPQILGWFLQFIPEDRSMPYESLEDAKIDISVIRKKIQSYSLSKNRDVHKDDAKMISETTST